MHLVLPHYTVEIVNGVMVIEDLSTGRSVTNAVADILHDLASYYHPFPKTIIYRDGDGTWEGIAHDKGVFSAFYPLGKQDRATAISAALGPRGAAKSIDPDPAAGDQDLAPDEAEPTLLH
jgi:hypothetical protein